MVLLWTYYFVSCIRNWFKCERDFASCRCTQCYPSRDTRSSPYSTVAARQVADRVLLVGWTATSWLSCLARISCQESRPGSPTLPLKLVCRPQWHRAPSASCTVARERASRTRCPEAGRAHPFRTFRPQAVASRGHSRLPTGNSRPVLARLKFQVHNSRGTLRNAPWFAQRNSPYCMLIFTCYSLHYC